jgi:hypothetical protein
MDGFNKLASAARTTSPLTPKVYESKIITTYQILLHPDCSFCRDKVNRAARLRLRLWRTKPANALAPCFLLVIWTIL